MTRPITDADRVELYSALGMTVQPHWTAPPDPDEPTVDDLADSIGEVLDQVPEPSIAKNAKHDDTCRATLAQFGGKS